MDNNTNTPLNTSAQGLGLPPIPSSVPTPPTTTTTTTTTNEPLMEVPSGLPPLDLKSETSSTTTTTTTTSGFGGTLPAAEKKSDSKPMGGAKKKVNKKMVIGGIIAAVLMFVAIGISRLLPQFTGEQRSRASYGCDQVANECNPSGPDTKCVGTQHYTCHKWSDFCPTTGYWGGSDGPCGTATATVAPSASVTVVAGSGNCVAGSHTACLNKAPGSDQPYLGSPGHCFKNGGTDVSPLCGWDFNQMCTPGSCDNQGGGIFKKCYDGSAGQTPAGTRYLSTCYAAGCGTEIACSSGTGGGTPTPASCSSPNVCKDNTPEGCNLYSMVSADGACSGGKICCKDSGLTATTCTANGQACTKTTGGTGVCSSDLQGGWACVSSAITTTPAAGNCPTLAVPNSCSGKPYGYYLASNGNIGTSSNYYCQCQKQSDNSCKCIMNPSVPAPTTGTGGGACVAAGQSCTGGKTCCGTADLDGVCQGNVGQEICQLAPKNICGAGGTCTVWKSHQCSSLAVDSSSNGVPVCNSNSQEHGTDRGAAEARSKATGCGQLDQVCSNDTGRLCGGFTIYNTSCGSSITTTPGDGGTPTTPPPGTAPACVNTRIFINGSSTAATSAQMNNLKVGDNIRMVVTGNVPEIAGAKFIVKVGSVDVSGGGYRVTSILTPIRSDGVKEFYYDYKINTVGNYTIEGYVNTVPPAATATPQPSAPITASPTATSTVGAPPTLAAGPWSGFPFPVSGIDAVSKYMQPNGLVRINAYKGNRYWGYTCTTSGNITCDAVVTLPLSSWATSISDPNGVFSSNPMPTDNVDAVQTLMYPSGVLRTTVYKGGRYWGYNCSNGSCTAAITLDMASAWANIANAASAWGSNPIATSDLTGAVTWIQPDGKIRNSYYKGNRYWVTICDLGADRASATGCTALTTNTLDSTATIPNSTTAWANNPFPVASQDAWTAYMINATTLRVDAFKDNRYWGYTCTYQAGTATSSCSATITLTLQEGLTNISNSQASLTNSGSVAGVSNDRTPLDLLKDALLSTYKGIFKSIN